MSAREDGAALMERIGISCEVGPATPYQDGEWTAFQRVYTFGRGRASEAFPYRMGIGNIPWAEIASGPRWPAWTQTHVREGDWPIINTLARQGARLQPEFLPRAADLAAHYAGKLKIQADPAEVLNALARDGAALDQTFAEWAPELGYDADSIKALRTWEECCNIGRRLLKLMSRSDMEAFGALEF